MVEGKNINNLIDQISKVDLPKLFDQVAENLEDLDKTLKKIDSNFNDKTFKKEHVKLKRIKRLILSLKKIIRKF
ncbi:hypothetical protein N9L60_01965 [Flavobacteriales bacterium]|nr:hypothetical protein [Flavobacteriales bacterium]|tara:strand:+ start:1623 stop:1844 length:222 start_codon:yes stop_codon:yes gene_type:complete